MGMACGLETICGQAYGAKQYKKLAVYTYQAIFALILVCLPISLLWVFMGDLLILIGQDPLISVEAGKYAMWMIPGLFAYAFCQPLFKFLQAQSLVLPMVLSSVLALLLHIPLCWVLVFKSGLGNAGAAASMGVSYWFNMIYIGLYIKYSDSCKAMRAPVSKEAFTGINEFLKLALPSAVMMCLEWWSFELLVLVSGLLPNPKLETSVLSICIISSTCIYTIPYGLGAATSTRVSNELGAGEPERARKAARVGIFIAVIESFIVSSTLFALRGVAGYAYSNNKEVTSYIMEMVPFLCVSLITYALQGVLSGVARGCGWQEIAAYVNLGAYYLFGLPIAMCLGFLLHFGRKGLWIGIMSGVAMQTILYAVVTGCTNWQQKANMARERALFEILP